jgi:hypothetical protein
MSDRDTQLDEQTRELLLAEKTPPGAPAEARTRVFSMLQASLGTPAGAHGGRPSAGEDRPPSRSSEGATGVAARGALGKIGPIAVAFLAGGAAGVFADRWVAPVPPQIVYVQVAGSAVPEEQVPPVESTAVSARPPPAAPPKVVIASRSSAAEPDLRAERELLDRARAAFAAGDPAATLAAVDLHAKKFPDGRLEEEREALAVKALVGVGRYEEARLRGARFRSRFPGSFLSPAIEEVLRTIP